MAAVCLHGAWSGAAQLGEVAGNRGSGGKGRGGAFCRAVRRIQTDRAGAKLGPISKVGLSHRNGKLVQPAVEC